VLCRRVQVQPKHSLDDITKVGQEDAPWFCSEHHVFVAFQFEDHGRYKSILGADDKDILKSVTIFDQLGGRLDARPPGAGRFSLLAAEHARFVFAQDKVHGQK